MPTRGPPPFATFDSDGNGYVDEQEFSRVHSARTQQRAEQGRLMRNAGNMPRFQDIDSDGDGRLSPEEHQAHQQQRIQMRYADLPAPAR